MNKESLFVSFWNVCLDNFPLGEFAHRCIAPAEARLCIDQARREGRLLCVSQKDLLAPYHEQERSNHVALCQVLHMNFGISLSINDFVSKNATADDPLYTILPLNCAQIRDNDRLLVINCSYRFNRTESYKLLLFEVEPESIEFHVIESKRGHLPEGKFSFQYFPSSERLSA